VCALPSDQQAFDSNVTRRKSLWYVQQLKKQIINKWHNETKYYRKKISAQPFVYTINSLQPKQGANILWTPLLYIYIIRPYYNGKQLGSNVACISWVCVSSLCTGPQCLENIFLGTVYRAEGFTFCWTLLWRKTFFVSFWSGGLRSMWYYSMQNFFLFFPSSQYTVLAYALWGSGCLR